MNAGAFTATPEQKAGRGAASKVNALADKLVQKGTISAAEANDIKSKKV